MDGISKNGWWNLKNDWANVAKMAERVIKSKKWLSHWKRMNENLKIANEIKKWPSHYSKNDWACDEISKMTDKI
jgi:hypothetical protein